MSRHNEIGRTATKVWRDGDEVFVLYHQTVVVQFNRRRIILRNGGWHTKTTMLRWNQASHQFGLGFSAYAKRGKWYVTAPWPVGGSQEFVDGEEMELVPPMPLSLPDLPKRAAPILDRYSKIDGWRGYRIPGLAIAGASDTGTWSDSPCPSGLVELEVSAFRLAASRAGFATRVRVGETSNVFCAKVWVTVHPAQWRRAASWALEYLREHDRGINYLHDAAQSRVLTEEKAA